MTCLISGKRLSYIVLVTAACLAGAFALPASAQLLPMTPAQQAQMEKPEEPSPTGTIRQQMEQDNAAQQAAREKIREELDKKIRDMAGETYTNRVKTTDKAQRAMSDYIKSLVDTGDDASLVELGFLLQRASLRLDGTPLATASAFDTFINNGATLTTLQLEPIYANYNLYSMESMSRGHAGMSLSSAGTSLSSAPNSLSSAGTSMSSMGNSMSSAGTSLSSVTVTPAIDWGGGLSLAGTPTLSLAGGPYDMDRSLQTAVSRLSPQGALLQSAGTYGRYEMQSGGAFNRFSGNGQLAGYLVSDADILRTLRVGDIGGLQRLLAQPFNVVMTWGAGAYDVDLHMTGPSGNGSDRFHIYYSARGSQEAFPFAELIKDCVCTSGSEVILTSQLLQGGVYRVSAFNYGNQSTTSTQLSTAADVTLQIVRGGTAVSVGNGTRIDGGTVIFQGKPKTGQPGNTWVGVEIDPAIGRINFVDQSTNSGGSGGVR